MQRLEHANLVVKDIQSSIDFLLTAFPQWKLRGEGQGQWAGQARNWAHIGDDDYYLTLNDGAVGENRNLRGVAPGLAHIGFEVENVDDLKKRLTAKGYAIDIEGRQHPYRKTVYFIDPNGFQFEFIQYLSEENELKNQYGGESGDLIKYQDPVSTLNGKHFIQSLYQAVDAKNIDYLKEVIGEVIHFRIGNHPAVTDKVAVLEANRNFFSSIQSMKHDLSVIWQDGEYIGCHGVVHYTRLDGSEMSAGFSTTLKMQQDKLKEYLVFADLSQLFKQ